jgi:hypothetical protein
MKSRHNRVRVSVLAVVLVLSVAGWATAQNPAVHGTGTPGTIPLWRQRHDWKLLSHSEQQW